MIQKTTSISMNMSSKNCYAKTLSTQKMLTSEFVNGLESYI